MLTFLSPLFLIGLLAAGIPLIIHLSRSRRTRKMRFSTTRFFTNQFLRSYRMSRLKQLLLLACRMALFGLLAMAFARPLLLPKSGSFLRGGSRSLVLVLDNSASMGYVENGQTLFERARKAGGDLIDHLGAKDTAMIVLASRRADGPRQLASEPTSDRGALRLQLDTAQVEALGTDLSGAVARARQLIASRKETSKEIYILSDLQDSGWELDRAPTQPSDPEVSYVFVSIRPAHVNNAAVTAVQYAAARPVVNVPFEFRPHIVSQGEQAKAGRVRLYIDGDKVAERQLERLRNGRWAVPHLSYRFTRPGWHSGFVEVDDDPLPIDNRRYFAVEVMDRIPVLAVDGAPSDIPRLDELFFFKAALRAAGGSSGSIPVDTISPGQLAGKDLNRYPLLVLANVSSLSAAAVEKVESYVDRGGSLLVFLGDRIDSAFYNGTLMGAMHLHGGLLPGRLVARVGDPASPHDFARIRDVAFDHPALAAFEDPQTRLEAVSFNALWQIQPDNAAVLMRASNQKASYPLLCERTFGKGRVMLFASTCDRDWTSFPIRPAYLLWLHELVAYLGQKPLGHQDFFRTGESVPIDVAATTGLPRVLVKKPDHTVGYPITTNDPDHPLVFDETEQAGIYHLADLDHHQERLMAVNLENYESNLTYLDDVIAAGTRGPERHAAVEKGVRQLVGEPTRLTYVEDPAHLSDVVTGTGRSFRLWDSLLWVVLIIALLEPWLANRISLRHYSRPHEVIVPRAASASVSVRTNDTQSLSAS